LSLKRHAVRRDANEPKIKKVLESMRVYHWDLDTPADLLCFAAGQFFVLEVKDPSQRWKVTDIEECLFQSTQGGPRWIVEYTEEVVQIVNGLRKGLTVDEIGLHDKETTKAGYRKA